MDELLKIIKNEYGITASRFQPLRGLWKLTGPQGTFLLKRMHCSMKHLVWLDHQLQELTRNGFTGIVPLIATRDGAPAFNHPRGNFIVTPWQPGNHPSFTNLNHLQQIAHFWSELHQTAQLVAIPEAPNIIHPLLDLEAKNALIATTLDRLRTQPGNNRIDRLLLKWGDYFLTQAATSLNRLQSLGFSQWLRATTAQGFCHNDPAPGNIIMQNKHWYLIDFELSGPGFFLIELTLLLQRALQANHWQPQLTEPILTAYYAACPARQTEENQFIPALLCFPRAFWRLCQQRFHEKLDWSESHFQSRLWSLTSNEPLRAQLLRQWFPELPSKVEADYRGGRT